MRRLKCGYAYTLSGAGLAVCIGALITAAATRNLELAMLGSVAFFGCLSMLLVALAFAWLTSCRRIQGRVDALDQERAKYHAARAFLDVEAERTANANEARELKASETLTEEREVLRKDYADKLCENLAGMARTRTKEVKEAWLLGFNSGQCGLTEDALEAGGILIPWPVATPHDSSTSGAGRYRS